MKKGIMVLAMLSTTAYAVDFQGVYQVNQPAAAIKQAAGELDQNIYCSQWGVTLKFKGNIVLETKDNKYRLTFDNMRSLDSGVLLADLPQTQESCQKSMKDYAEELHNKISRWKDF